MKIINAILIISVFVINSCNTTEPPENNFSSHDVKWQTFSFGEHSSSILRDVVIIGENNIWAVGEIFLKDSLGQIDYERYGFAHWDGVNWTTYKIKAFTFYNDSVSVMPNSIFAFSGDNIWFISGGVHHFDGRKITKSYWINYGPDAMFEFEQALHEITALDENDIYVAGDNGALAHFDGAGWTKIETNTALDFDDLWSNNRIPKQVVAVAGKDYENFNKEIYSIQGTTINKLLTDNNSYFFRSLWFDYDYQACLIGGGIFKMKHILREKSLSEVAVDRIPYSLFSVRGNHLNDIFACGAFGEIIHYNGETWKSYIDETGIESGNYYKIAVKGNIIVAVGDEFSKAKIALGIRQSR